MILLWLGEHEFAAALTWHASSPAEGVKALGALDAEFRFQRAGGVVETAWMTPLLCVLVAIPGRGWRSTIATVCPASAIVAAEASPETPAPMTRVSMGSIRLSMTV